MTPDGCGDVPLARTHLLVHDLCAYNTLASLVGIGIQSSLAGEQKRHGCEQDAAGRLRTEVLWLQITICILDSRVRNTLYQWKKHGRKWPP